MACVSYGPNDRIKPRTRIRIRRSNSTIRPWNWRVFCPDCGHDTFMAGTLADAYRRAAYMAVDHIPGGASCAFTAAYSYWWNEDNGLMAIVNPNRTRAAFIPASGIERDIRDIVAAEIATDDFDGLVGLYGTDEAALAVVDYLRRQGLVAE